jgi:hypothetical protein
MRKVSLSEWAQIGEVIGMIAVVISLGVVVVSIKQNTIALQSANVNLVFERHSELQDHFIADSTFAAIAVKKRTGVELTEIESIRWEKYVYNLMDVWAMAYGRNEDGLLPPAEWEAWNTYFVNAYRNGDEKITKAQWDGVTAGFEPAFWQHVDQAVFSGHPASE